MVMTSVSGHLLTHAFVSSFKNWKGCDPIALFDAPVVKSCPEDYVKVKKTLEREIRHCAGLIIWTDCDREGENIGYEIIDVCRAVKPNLSIYRAKFSEMTAGAIKRALANLARPDELQSKAVDVRSELDLRIGAAFTRFQTMRLQGVFPTQIDSLVSYGSCQIPTLGFVVQRYKEAENFVPQPFWKIRVVHTLEGGSVEFNWGRNRLFDQQCCQAFLMQCQLDPTAYVVSVVEKPKSKWRPTALDTVELEKIGSRKLKLTAKQTMTIAEKLYSQGLISYPRTETNMFSKEVDLRSLVEQQSSDSNWGRFASKVLQWGMNPKNGKKSDQAHPPIHPTKYTSALSGDEKKVYELIVRHFLACVSRDAVGSETIVSITVAEEEFTATGLVIKERNYLEVYLYDKWNAKEIHNYVRGTHFEPTEISMNEGSTTAPALLTEADLISLMEKHGIGTDATHAEHINTIKERGYIGVADRGFLVPGVLGMGLVEGYDAMNLALAQPELRAGLEVDLKRICEGTRNPSEVLTEQIDKYRDLYRVITERALSLDRSLGIRLNANPQQAEVPTYSDSGTFKEVLSCTKCNRFKMILKKKKDGNGFYISCLGFPECKNVIWLSNGIKEVTVTDDDCSKCRRAKQLFFKFSQVATMAFLNCDFEGYKTCILCDANLRNILDIRLPSANPGTNSSSSSSVPSTYSAPSHAPRSTNSNGGLLSRPNQPNPPRQAPLDNYFNNRPPSSSRGDSSWDDFQNPNDNRRNNSNNNNNKRRSDSMGGDGVVRCQTCNEEAKK